MNGWIHGDLGKFGGVITGFFVTAKAIGVPPDDIVFYVPAMGTSYGIQR